MSRWLTMCAEVRDAERVWRRAEQLRPNTRWDETSWWDFILEHPSVALDEPVVEYEPVYQGGHRALMDVLVYGVRSRVAPDGADHYFLHPIAEERGIPDDATEATRAELRVSDWDPRDLPTASWLLLGEILTYDWDQPHIEVQGFAKHPVPDKAPHRVVPEGEGWVQFGGPWLVRPGVVREVPEGYQVYTYYRTTKLCREIAAPFLEHVVPKLKAWGDPDEVRVIFRYD